MPLAAPVIHTTLSSRPPDRRGKVRDLYACDDRLLLVATDRVSVFDSVLGSDTRDKGKVPISTAFISTAVGLPGATGEVCGVPLPSRGEPLVSGTSRPSAASPDRS